MIRCNRAYIYLPDRSIDDLTDAEDRLNWFLAALSEREGQDFSKSSLGLEELEAIWNDLQEAQGKDTGEGLAPTPADKKVSVTFFGCPVGCPTFLIPYLFLQIHFGSKDHPMKPKNIESPRPQPKSLPRLEHTDHTALASGTSTNTSQDHAPDGKLTPIVNKPTNPEPSTKPLPRLGPTDHTTIAHDVPTNPKYERGRDGKQRPEPVTFAHRVDKGKGKAGMYFTLRL